MALFESNHPFGRDVETLHSALLSGMADDPKYLPHHIKLNYEDPITSGDGVGTLVAVDWETENRTSIYYPLVVEEDDMTWRVSLEDSTVPIKCRVHITDLLDRGFVLTVAKELGRTPYFQFDVIDDGIVFSAQMDGKTVVDYGAFEGERYDIFQNTILFRAGVAEVIQLAMKY